MHEASTGYKSGVFVLRSAGICVTVCETPRKRVMHCAQACYISALAYELISQFSLISSNCSVVHSMSLSDPASPISPRCIVVGTWLALVRRKDCIANIDKHLIVHGPALGESQCRNHRVYTRAAALASAQVFRVHT
jgi:hypothetical protein